ncbi:molybdate ABC transporter substrate-binding protein [Pinirhizobacter sp.]|jgi:molybdate transport system substrate-binding protein|uniref:molybdate ABC transporter substrate-binding protein n=1 Tax=Pinirhizobacter sp. TaxID=2950432 RepID=UPI002F4113D1
MNLRRLILPALLIFSLQANASDIVVSAAASLTNVFGTVAKAYESKHPGTHVVLNFAASDVLMQQIANGAPADVFASADETAMDKAEKQGVVQKGTRRDFAANELVLIVPAAGKFTPASLNDLTSKDVGKVAVADPASVPAGRYTKSALEAARLWEPVSAKAVLAQNVRQALDYVARDEVDAGFVFATDATIAAGKVRVAMRVPTPTPITYPLAVVAHSKQPAEAKAFTDFVLSPEGQGLLAKAGFHHP